MAPRERVRLRTDQATDQKHMRGTPCRKRDQLNLKMTPGVCGAAGAGAISAELQHCGSPGKVSSDLLTHRAAEQDLHADPPHATAAPSERASAWGGPGSGQRAGFAQAALKTPFFLLPATIPPFL